MPSFSTHFALGKTQGELDFVNVELNEDLPLFLDPFAVSQRPDRWSFECRRLIIGFFQTIIDEIRAGNDGRALALLSHLQEPNETRLGYSSGRPQGAGIGGYQAEQLFKALKASTAVRTGFIHSLEECELVIDGIARDKISDLTTNVLRGMLATYTKAQCDLHGVTTRPAGVGAFFDLTSQTWKNKYYELPVVKGEAILLVPKAIVRYDIAYNHRTYYRHFALEYLKAEHLAANSSLVHTLKNGERRVYKTDLEDIFPCTKENLFKFLRDHPGSLEEYRAHLAGIEKRGPKSVVEDDDQPTVAAALIDALRLIAPGATTASEYHSLMIGILEFLFFPGLLNPVKEREIHDGRKRIDIVMENGADTGPLEELHRVKKLPCAYVPIECKNYRTDAANPEIDQLAGRFSTNRGQLGILACRRFENRELFVKRCRDTLKDGRGLIVPLDDALVIRMLEMIRNGRRRDIAGVLRELIGEIWLS
jgi:hypothetical protein